MADMSHNSGEASRGVRVGCVLLASMLLAGCWRSPPAGEPLDVVAMIGEPGEDPGQFGYPRATCGDGKTLWVIDKLARVQRFDAMTGESMGVWRMPKFDKGKPCGLAAWVPANTSSMGGSDVGPVLFVVDTHEQRVRLYQTNWTTAGKPGTNTNDPLEQVEPELLASFGTYGEGPGEFVYPTDVAFITSEDGNALTRLYVSEYGGNDRINIFDVVPPLRVGMREGEFAVKFVRSFGTFGSSASSEDVQFSRPQSIALDVANDLMVIADSCNHRIGTFTLDGTLRNWFGSPEGIGKQPGQFSYPYGVVLLGDGSAMVSEFGNNRVQRIDIASGQSLGIFGQPGRSEGQLSTQWSLTMVQDRIFVLDSGNSRVQVIEKPRGFRPLRELASGDATNGGVR
jgi:hypothetical protein